jgi:hypothetical protein
LPPLAVGELMVGGVYKFGYELEEGVMLRRLVLSRQKRADIDLRFLAT